MTTRVWKTVAYLFFAVGVIGIVSTFGYSSHYGNANPTAPDQRTGHIYAHNYHGRVVFLTEKELFTMRLAHGALIVGALGFFVAGSVGGLFRKA